MASTSRYTATNSRWRKNYGKLSNILEIPDLIAIQKKSYDRFLQANTKPEEREDVGLQGVFKSVFPIKDFNETASLEFVSYSFETPKYEVDECRQRGMTFAAPLKVVVRLVMWEQDEEGKAQNIRDVKEQEVYFGEIPLMTQQGTFIVNGTERVVVSQLHRSPGVSFDIDKGKNLVTGARTSFTGRVIPYRGSWLDFEFDAKDLVYVRIDRRRKMFATILLKALGYSEQDLLNYFYKAETYEFANKKLIKNVVLDALPSQTAYFDIKDSAGKIIVKKGKRFTKFALRNIEKSGVKEIQTLEEELIGRFAAEHIVDPKTGEVILEVNQELTEEKLEKIKAAGIPKIRLIYVNNLTVFSSLRDTLIADKVSSPDEAILEIYKRMRPGDPPTPEACQAFFQNLFFKADKYDLSQVGRLKINHKFNLNVPLDHRVLTKDDIMETVRYLLELKSGRGEVDDIDHLGNRRVRSVSELLENQYRIGLVRMERAIRERMSLQELETLMPHELINAKPVSAVVKEFFGSSQLSQFMDQTNPLCEITHKRRLSALGPGGLTRDRAGFEVRDVHATHYGRICPIETPEGPNIGLIASLATYARVNEFGFIETPYRVVKNGIVSSEIIYCSALDEQGRTIAQANASIDEKGRFTGEAVSCRRSGEPVLAKSEEVDLMDVSPNQLVSVAASLVPFLEHDDANRALMGSNMQRQAVPLIRTHSPLVGTGIESIVARDSGVTAVARHSGWVDSVDAGRIVVRIDKDAPENKEGIDIHVDICNLTKYQRSNQNTCINQKPIVTIGDYVHKGDVIADGQATDMGELALGQNVVVAFMSWGGYNYEDSILISERVVKDDTYTSVHIEEFEIAARDTKLGMEEITRDIPNVGEDALRNLDESGIIRIGASVKPGDILVGKVTPKGETQLSPEEKLLRAIFGEKAADVKDTSLRVPPGVVGTIIDARVFSREGVEKDTRAKSIEEQDAAKILKDQEDEIKIVKSSAFDRIRDLLLGKRVSANVKGKDGSTVLEKGKAITQQILDEVPKVEWHKMSLANEQIEGEIRNILQNLNDRIERIKILSNARLEKLRKGDELPPGVIKLVKVYVAIKRKLSVGDKMAGRHGNKGVVSCILPEEDMPYMADGRPVDIVLNPLGVPSRMNVGQLLETHLGWVARKMGDTIQDYLQKNYNASKLRSFILDIFKSDDKELKKFLDSSSEDELKTIARKLSRGVHMAVPVFEGIDESAIVSNLERLDQNKSGQMILFDGRDGRPFDRPVTVGVIYIMKLHHIVDDKIHARSIGPYSIVTQQPLGGKAQFGGQRLGEMEVWAMEAYGAAFALQEFLTVKSDDIVGRTRMYEAIVKGENTLEPGLPESFNVLCTELKGLGLNVELVYDESKEKMA